MRTNYSSLAGLEAFLVFSTTNLKRVYSTIQEERYPYGPSNNGLQPPGTLPCARRTLMFFMENI